MSGTVSPAAAAPAAAAPEGGGEFITFSVREAGLKPQMCVSPPLPRSPLPPGATA